MKKSGKRKFAPVAKTKKGVPKKYVSGAKNPQSQGKRDLTNCEALPPGQAYASYDESYQ